MHRSLMAIRNNAVGVTQIVLANMGHRLLNTVDNFDRQNRRQVFFIPITHGSRDSCHQGSLSSWHIRVTQPLCQKWLRNRWQHCNHCLIQAMSPRVLQVPYR